MTMAPTITTTTPSSSPAEAEAPSFTVSSPATDRVREYTAHNGTVYTLQGLASEPAIDAWATFCASVFSYKSNPPPADYFSRHYLNDPHRGGAQYIRVAYCRQQENAPPTIVASCRIFWRLLYDGTTDNQNKLLVAAGIGEVCTHPHHRRLGLSRQLLQDALDIIQSAVVLMKLPPHEAGASDAAVSRDVDVSLLHAASNFLPVYQSVGYKTGQDSHWSTVPVRYAENLPPPDDDSPSPPLQQQQRVRLARFPADTDNLRCLHQAYTEQEQLSGCIHRSTSYWNEYTSRELDRTLFVYEYEYSNDSEMSSLSKSSSSNPLLLGWMSLRPRGENKFQVRDFGMASPNTLPPNTTVYHIFSSLLVVALKRQNAGLGRQKGGNGKTGNEQQLLLHLPNVVFQQIQASYQEHVVSSRLSSLSDDGCGVAAGSSNFNDTSQQQQQQQPAKILLDFDSAIPENDNGWMYKPFTERGSTWLQQRQREQRPHLIWPADSF